MSKLLINEPPLQVLPSFAQNIGLHEVIILQQVHYWVDMNQKADKNFGDCIPGIAGHGGYNVY